MGINGLGAIRDLLRVARPSDEKKNLVYEDVKSSKSYLNKHEYSVLHIEISSSCKQEMSWYPRAQDSAVVSLKSNCTQTK